MREPNPWQAPERVEARAPAASPPAVVGWFKAYCILCSITYAMTFGMFVFARDLVLQRDDRRALDMMHVTGDAFQTAMYALIVGLSATLAIAFALPLFLRPSKGTWIYSLVLICITMTSCMCLPMAVPLLVFWFKADTKQYFGA